MARDIGDTVRTPITVMDPAGGLTNATMTAVVTRPDGTTTSPAVINTGTGQYYVDHVPTMAGPYIVVATASGTVTEVYTSSFFVREAGARIVSLAEVKTHLNKDLAITDDDDELTTWIDVATWQIENIAGAVVPRTITSTLDGIGTDAVYLPRGPVLDVSSVKVTWATGDVRTLTAEPADGLTVTDDQYKLDRARRRILLRSGGATVRPPYGLSNVEVTYRVGRSPIGENFRGAALELISHLWRVSQLTSGGSRPRGMGQDQEAAQVALGFAIPHRVREILSVRKAPLVGSY